MRSPNQGALVASRFG